MKKTKRKLPLMHSFARIKPASADKKGGIAASQTITGFDENAGSVTIGSSVDGAKGKARVFDHFEATIGPETSQTETYEKICAPLVESWINGYDVDVICYGQTGSGKTYTQFGPPHSMKKAFDSLGKNGGVGTISSDGIMSDNYGFILRTGFEGLKAVTKYIKENNNTNAMLHGSMVEFSILNAKSQCASDLLNNKKKCFVDKYHHLEGAIHLPLTDARSLVEMAAAVEGRLERGTKMNNSSSRSHCITAFTLHVRDDEGNVRVSRFNFFDFMGSERFRGANAAHNQSQSAHSTMAGAEGIFANYSLLFLGEAVRAAANARRKKKGSISQMGGSGFLNELLHGSLVGNAITAMITCLSPSKRNGAESLLSCKYSKDMAKMQNDPKPQKNIPFATKVEEITKEHAKSYKIASGGVLGKYQQKRMAEVTGYENTLNILKELGSGGGHDDGGGGGGDEGGGSGKKK